MFAGVKSTFWPSPEGTDHLLVARLRLVSVLSLIVGVLGIANGTATFPSTWSTSSALALWCVVGPLVVLFAPILSAVSGKPGPGGILLVVFLFVDLTGLAVSANGVLWHHAIYLPAVPILSGMIIGRTAAVLATVATLAALAVLSQLTVPVWVALSLGIFIVGLMATLAVFLTIMGHTTKHLIELREEASAANAAKTDFLAHIAHEIRTPLNGVIGTLNLLHDELKEGEAARLAAVGKTSADTLLTMLNDVLDYSKIIAGGIQLEHRSFAGDHFLHQVMQEMASIAREKNIRLTCTTSPDLPPYLVGDPVRLAQVLRNLVSNALKFTEQGGDVRIDMHPSPGADRSILVSVSDSGIGMSEEATGRIFEKYEQAESGTTRKYGGTGLGLNICRQLVALHGGRIGVRSVLGEGSTFWFTFPLKPGAAPAPTPSPPAQQTQPNLAPTKAEQKPGRGLRVLLAEDNQTNILIATKYLAKMNIRPIVAHNGREAVELCTREQFDLILMDVQMPEIDGLDATRAIRTGGKLNAATPIVAMSANDCAVLRDKYTDAGMNSYLPKPCSAKELSAVVKLYSDTGPSQYAH